MRDDGGRFSGVYEKVHADGHSSFYAKDAGQTFAIRYDSSDARWRVINGRNPRSYYQMPILFNGQGRWSHASLLRGGGRDKVPKGKKGKKDAAADTAPAASTSADGAGANKRLTVEMEGFFESKAFKNAQKNFDEDLKFAVELTVSRYRDYGTSGLHKLKGGPKNAPSTYTMDLAVGGDTGRGKWRLVFEYKKGVLTPTGVADTHKG